MAEPDRTDADAAVFHCYDPEFGGNGIFEVCATLDAAIEACNADIKAGWTPDHGDEWNGDVACISVYRAPRDCADPREEGELVAQATEVDVSHRPDDVDEDGYSASDSSQWWPSGVDYICNYRVEATTTKEPSNG